MFWWEVPYYLSLIQLLLWLHVVLENGYILSRKMLMSMWMLCSHPLNFFFRALFKPCISSSASNNYFYCSHIFRSRGMIGSNIFCENWLYIECTMINEFHTLRKCSIVNCKYLWNHLSILSLRRFELSSIQVVMMNKVNNLAWKFVFFTRLSSARVHDKSKVNTTSST